MLLPKLVLLLLLAPIVFGQNATDIEEEVGEEEETTDEYFEEGIAYNSTDLTAENGTEIDFNSTELAVENSTLAPYASIATTLPNTTSSTTPKPTTTTPAPVNFPQRAVGEVVCPCDLKVNMCDVNCCCDPDCTKFDFNAFPQCQKSIAPQDECNTNGFLCIFKENTPERHWLTNPKITNTLKEFDVVALRSPKWSWPGHEVSGSAKFTPKAKYKAGDIIWSTKDNKTFSPFVLPLLGRNCAKTTTVLYLQKASTSCTLEADSPILKEGHLNGLWLLADTSLPIANQTEPWVKMQTLYCLENFTSVDNCTKSINKSGLQMREMQIKIYHNGTQGILAAKTEIIMKNKTTSHRPLKLNIGVDFYWSDEPPSVTRSGSPGYLHGLPILTGVLSSNKTTVTSIGHFKLASADSGGACNGNMKIVFGDDLLVSCDLTLNLTGCAATDIVNALAGRHLNAVAGAFGDSEEGTLKDWLPILVKEQPPTPVTNCNRAPTSLSVQILWAKVGSLESPQSKLTGMLLSFGGSKTISGNSVRLTTSVTFKEVTTGLKGLFAPPPKYEIRLPSDFFYPLYSSACGVHLNIFLLTMVFFLTL